MSINSAMLAGSSGLRANASALAAISDNISNVNTVGYKRLLRFPEVTTDRVRLTIIDSRDCPMIREFGLYKASARELEE